MVDASNAALQLRSAKRVMRWEITERSEKFGTPRSFKADFTTRSATRGYYKRRERAAMKEVRPP